MSASSSRHGNTAPVVNTSSYHREPDEAGKDDGQDQTINDEEEEEEEESEPSSPLLPPPDFKPFFTLISDASTTSHQHPAVHYVFADDDQDIITNAALSSQNERIIIVDMASDGKQVISTTSLSPDWQGLTSKVTQAPSWGDATDTNTGVMLSISGQEVKMRKNMKAHDDVAGLIRVFDERLEDLSGILGAEEDTTHVQVDAVAE